MFMLRAKPWRVLLRVDPVIKLLHPRLRLLSLTAAHAVYMIKPSEASLKAAKMNKVTDNSASLVNFCWKKYYQLLKWTLNSSQTYSVMFRSESVALSISLSRDSKYMLSSTYFLAPSSFIILKCTGFPSICDA